MNRSSASSLSSSCSLSRPRSSSRTVRVITVGDNYSPRADHLMIKTQDGKDVRIPLTDKTEFVKGRTQAAAPDAKVGSRVVVHLGEGGNALHVQLLEDKVKK